MTTYARIPLRGERSALVDEADVELVQGLAWYVLDRGQNLYAARSAWIPGAGGETQYMHALITGFPMTDHVNGDGLDNRRANLRSVTNSQNMANKRRQRGARSRFKGLHQCRKTGKWVAQICLHGRKTNLGAYVREEDAALAYDAAARELFGPYAALNFPLKGERSAL